ncbi:MAG TPA: DUF222 domain-containing protein, partial [Mycobacteriales bacterium]|nr:DUF222 domain-containing protein [Mycobacteriales bacterium]
MTEAREMPSWLAFQYAEEDAAGPMTVPDTLPEWLLEAPHLDEEPACCTESGADRPPASPAVETPVRWAVPGVWDDQPAGSAAPEVGVRVRQLQDAVAALGGIDPTALPGPLALAEAEALERLVQRLRVLLLPRLADLHGRRLFELAGFHSVRGWQHAVAPDAVAADRTLARRLTEMPLLEDAVTGSRVSLSAAHQVAKSVQQVGKHLDRPDGLVEGQSAEEVVEAVLDNTVDLVCRSLGGADEALVESLDEDLAQVREASCSQRSRVEGGFVVLAEHLPAVPALKAALEEQVFAILPNLLEQQQRSAEERRGAALRRNADGSWELEGRLTPECGERLFAALAAEARRDPANPVDTLARQHAREAALVEAGLDPFLMSDQQLGADGPEPLPPWEREALASLQFEGPEQSAAQQELVDLLDAAVAPAAAVAARYADTPEGVLLVPRSRSRRLHDALDRLLTRYLGAGLGGARAKVPVQAMITIPAALLEGRPGALPGRGGSGRPLARSLLRVLWEDATITGLLLDRTWQPLGAAHCGRMPTGTEFTALLVKYDGRCAGADCCPGEPDPLIPLVAHHVKKHADHGHTVLAELLPVCERLHQDLHLGKR